MDTPDSKLTLDQQMAAVKAERQANRKPVFRRSRLDRHRADIEYFASQGISNPDIAAWLAKHKRLRVHTSTIQKRLQQWRDHGTGT